HEHCVRTAHAEGNAIVQAAKRGIAVAGGTMYCKMEPCLRCCVDIINAGIVRVVAEYEYHGAALTREWFKQAGVELVVLNRQEAY
ncbi:MAG: deoxycytidylate deaminase, partial [bacterium]